MLGDDPAHCILMIVAIVAICYAIGQYFKSKADIQKSKDYKSAFMKYCNTIEEISNKKMDMINAENKNMIEKDCDSKVLHKYNSQSELKPPLISEEETNDKIDKETINQIKNNIIDIAGRQKKG